MVYASPTGMHDGDRDTNCSCRQTLPRHTNSHFDDIQMIGTRTTAFTTRTAMLARAVQAYLMHAPQLNARSHKAQHSPNIDSHPCHASLAFLAFEKRDMTYIPNDERTDLSGHLPTFNFNFFILLLLLILLFFYSFILSPSLSSLSLHSTLKGGLSCIILSLRPKPRRVRPISVFHPGTSTPP